MGTAEILENSPALLPDAVRQLRSVAEEFNNKADSEMNEAAFEDFTAQCQSIITKYGGLHIASVGPLVRSLD